MQRIVLCAWVLLGACTQASPPEQPGADETKTETKQDPVAGAPWTEPARTHVVLGKHAPETKPARFVAVELEKRTVSSPIEMDGLERADWPGHFASIAAHGGGTRFVTQRPAASGAELIALDVVDAKSTITVALPDHADGMHLIGSSAFVGVDNTLYFLDLSQAAPKLELLLARSLPGGKAYDLFVRNGAWLFAIDDVVRPIYADTFRLQAAGMPVHDQALELPSMINGMFYAGALHPAGSDAGTLFLLGSYGIMDGSGHDLAALPLLEGRPKHDGSVVLNSTVLTDPPVLEEHVDRGTGKPTKLVAGTEFTAWTGVELVGKGGTHLLLPAGARGLLAIPALYKPDTKAEVVFAEPVADVEVMGEDRMFVLSGKQLVELTWSLPKPKEVARTELPDAFDRIID